MCFENREESDTRTVVAGTWNCEDCGSLVANDVEICAVCEADEMEEGDYWPEYDGQPDEAQEWHDFDPDC